MQQKCDCLLTLGMQLETLNSSGVWELIGISTSFSQPQISLNPIPARDFKTACGIFKSIHQSVGSNVKNAQPAQYLFQPVTIQLVHSEQATSNSKVLGGKNHNKWNSVPKRLNHDCKDQEKTVSLEQGIMHYKIRCMGNKSVACRLHWLVTTLISQ